MSELVERGVRVALAGPDGERRFVIAEPGTHRVPGLGVVDGAVVLGKPYGSKVKLGPKEYVVIRPRLTDFLKGLERRAQIVTPKDMARIVFEAGLGDGDRVVEAGVGSGFLTIALAHAVAPSGRLFAYDNRAQHLEIGRRNVSITPWLGSVEFKVGDVHKDVTETGLDAFILDLPDPENAVAMAKKALASGGVFISYVPHVPQVQAVTKALREAEFHEIETIELLERRWVVENGGARPDFQMLGHTGFLTKARR